MKLGVVSAIYDGFSFEEMIDSASSIGYECVEVACWPQGKAERRYAGVSHIDVDNTSPEYIAYVKDYCKNNIVRYAIPAEYEFRSSLPTTKIGKIDYRAVQN